MTRSRLAIAAITAAAITVWPDVRSSSAAQPATTPLLVNSAWLAEHLNDPNLVLLQVGERAEYDSAHIAGARYVSQRDVSVSSMDHEKGLMLEMPTAHSLRAMLQRLGISDNSRVVVYYGSDWVSPSTRIVFTLDYAGLGAQTSLLDGGMKAWIAAGHPVTNAASPAQGGRLSALKIKPIVVDATWVGSHLHSPGISIVDGRDASYYDGVEATGPRRGHIPGAHSVPFTEIADDNNVIRTPAELTALFTKAGVAPNDTVVGYCHIGQQATAMLFAARYIGHPVKLYDGSMQEWSRRADLPIEVK